MSNCRNVQVNESITISKIVFMSAILCYLLFGLSFVLALCNSPACSCRIVTLVAARSFCMSLNTS